MIYLKTFKLSDSRITNNNIYPFNELLIHEEEYKYITNKNIKIRKCNANDVDSI